MSERLRPELGAVVAELLAASAKSREVSLDAIGLALGARVASAEDIEAIMVLLEKRGRRLVGPSGGGGEHRLKSVLVAARALRGELGRTPTVGEIVERSGLSRDDVQNALALARVMQR